MRLVLEAIRAELATLGRPVHVGRAPRGAVPPFYVIDGTKFLLPRRLTEATRRMGVYLDVRSTADTEGNAQVYAEQAQQLLSPLTVTRDIVTPRRAIRVRYSGQDGTFTDPDYADATSMPPAYTIDRYVCQYRTTA